MWISMLMLRRNLRFLVSFSLIQVNFVFDILVMLVTLMEVKSWRQRRDLSCLRLTYFSKDLTWIPSICGQWKLSNLAMYILCLPATGSVWYTRSLSDCSQKRFAFSSLEAKMSPWGHLFYVTHSLGSNLQKKNKSVYFCMVSVMFWLSVD